MLDHRTSHPMFGTTLPVLLLVLLAASGCSLVQPERVDEPGAAMIRLNLPQAIQSTVEEVRVTVSAADMQDIIQALTVTDTTAYGTISSIPAGNARRFTVDVFTTGSVLTYTGSDTLDVAPGQTIFVEIDLVPATGTAVITARFPELVQYDFDSPDTSAWSTYTQGTATINISGGLAILDTGTEIDGDAYLMAKHGFLLGEGSVRMTVRVRCNFNTVLGNHFHIGFRRVADSHDDMIELNKLHDPTYGPNLDNLDQFRMVTRTSDGWNATDPVTAEFTAFREIEFRCSANRVELYIDGNYSTRSEAYITGEMIYPFFKVSNTDQATQKSMEVDWVRILSY